MKSLLLAQRFESEMMFKVSISCLVASASDGQCMYNFGNIYQML